MANSPVVTSLPAYVEEKRLPLITKLLVGARTIEFCQLETDVKQKTALNQLITEVVYGDGSACGWNEAGTSTLSQRFIDPAFFKINMGFCDKKLLRKWASYEVQLAAGREVLPFEEKFVDEIIKNSNVKLDKILWQGDSANAGGAIECDGFIKQLNVVGAGTVKVQFTAGTSAYNRVKAVYNAIPAAVIAHEGTRIFVSEADYRAYIQDLVTANLYHFNPDYGKGEYPIPGTNVIVTSINGLDGSKPTGANFDIMVAANVTNLYYGCGNEDDKDTIDLWYSKDNREFRLAGGFSAGVGIGFPDQCVISYE